jgi:serine/threonine-protein kinase
MDLSPADRNLLLGMLTVQLDFVRPDALVTAIRAWAPAKTTSLGPVLVASGALTPEELALFETITTLYLGRHGGRAGEGLAALTGTPGLREELEAIGDADLGASLALLQTPPPPAARGPNAQRAADGARFRILRAHAEGGLGKVSLARDEQLRRDVALKEIKERYAHDVAARARFLREAEVTGALEHPGVVPVYGLGVHPDGRPFYAMRFIQGESLEQAIDRFHVKAERDSATGGRELELRGLLRRFIDVCNAVAYAHSRGVVHRDLKPANVMLGPYGETLVVDWGLARVLGQAGEASVRPQPSETNLAATRPGQVLGTPMYMAPEQADGRTDEVGPASDIYSLGATLYTLLTNRPPVAGQNLADVLGAVRAGRYLPPEQANPAAPRALAAVCRQAMALRPDDRYASAADLARDVDRWLADEPVTAYREPLGARLGRLARRHRTLTSVTVALLLAGVLGLSLGLWAVRAEERRTAEERDLAEANLALARQAVDECFDVAQKHPLLEQEHMRQVRKLLLEKALPFYRNFKTRRPDKPGIKHVMAKIAFRVGYIASQAGQESEEAAAYQEARALYERLVADFPDEAEPTDGLARTVHNLAYLHHRTQAWEAAGQEYREALRLWGELLDRHPDVADYQVELVSVHNNLGNYLKDTGDPAGSLASYREALRRAASLAERYPDVPRYRAELATCHHNLGLSESGDREKALAQFQDALRLWRQLVERYPEVHSYQAGLARTLDSVAMVQKDRDREAALQSLREAQRLQVRLVERHPEVDSYRAELAGMKGNLGLVQYEAGDRAGALQSYEEARRLALPLAEQYPQNTAFQADLGRLDTNLAGVRLDLGDRAGALEVLREALPIQTRLVEGHPEVDNYRAELARTHNNLGNTLRQAGDAEGALAAYRAALRLKTELADKNPNEISYQVDLAGTRGNLAVWNNQAGKRPEALALLGQAIEGLHAVRRRSPDYHNARQFLCNSLNNRAVVLCKQGKWAEAAADWEEAVGLVQGPVRSQYRMYRTEALARAGDHSRAAAEAVDLARTNSLAPASLYDLACDCSLCAKAAAADPRVTAEERRRLVEQYGGRAVEFLHKARAGGFFKDAAAVRHMKEDPDLEAVRGREDYRRLLAELEPGGGPVDKVKQG